jgi:hypothetical protein
MPMRYERDDARRRVVVIMQGAFAMTDFLAVIERQWSDNAWAYGTLHDLSGMTGEPTIADLRQSLIDAALTHQLRGPIAILATDPVVYNRVCTYAALRHSTLPVKLFRDWEEADRWLTTKLHGERR